MNISRRDLYAAGEPLGDCATRKVAGRTIYGCGGDGGGDGGASEREAARQARIDRATNAVNAIFGKAAPVAPTRPSLGNYAITTMVEKGSGVGDNSSGEYVPYTTYNTGAFNSDMSDYKADLAAYNAAQGAAEEREKLYSQVGADTRDYFTKQLGEDAEQALRQQRFLAARNGTFGSSQAIDMQREFDRRNDRGLLDVANRADSAETNLRTNDEKSRIDLISRIVNGADQASATSSALSQLQTNAKAAQNDAQSGRMANVFAGALDAWNANQVAQGEEAARRKFASEYGSFFSNNTGGNGVQGTVTKG